MQDLKLRLPDNDLVPLLESCDNDELENLVQYLTKKGKFTCRLVRSENYKENQPDHKMYCHEIAAEIQKFGGNTVLNLLRNGFGVEYREIVLDVSQKLGIKSKKGITVDDLEKEILLKILEKSWDKMGGEEKRSLLKGIIEDTKDVATGTGFPAAILKGVLLAGGSFASFKISSLIANSVSKLTIKKGITGLVGKSLSKWFSVLTGPVGLGITALWTVFDLAGPAYRVTVPCVLHIAMLRQLSNLKKSGNDPRETEI